MNKEKKYKILFVKRDDSGCGFYRIEQPAKYIQRMGLAEVKVSFKSPSEDDLLWADLVVFQEMGNEKASEMARFCIKNKIPYVCEFDDFIQHVSPNNKGGYGAWNPGTLFAHRAMVMAQSAQALTVSTNWLAREYFPYNKNIYVIPNYLDQELWDNPITKRVGDKIRIGWAGGNAHGDDLKMISKVINKIVKEYKGKVVFETMGMTENELFGIFPMKNQKEVCSHCGNEGDMHIFYGEALNIYPMVIASKGWDIALAPVINNAFGNAKSDLKLKEYSALGYPVIASKVTPYIEAKNNNAQVLLAETFDDWYNFIKALIEDKDMRDNMSRHNKEWVKQYWIHENAKKIFEVYKEIINNYKNHDYKTSNC